MSTNGHDHTLIAKVSTIVTEALLESLPDTIRTRVASAMETMGEQITRLNEANCALAASLDQMREQLLRHADELAGLRRAELNYALGSDVQALAAELRSFHGVRADLDEFSKTATSAEGRLLDVISKRFDALSDEQSSLIASRIEALPKAADGVNGKDGRDGVDGRDGKDGAEGARGPAGPAGKDAVFTKPIPYVKGRSYSPGAIVMHRGGEWYAEAETDIEPGAELSGWSLIHDGWEPKSFELNEEGYLFCVMRTASGRAVSVQMPFRPQQFAGLYDAQRSYFPNDYVQDDGGLWLALDRTTGQAPGTPNSGHLWRLIQKRPKDGREGRPGRDGVNGTNGRDGERGAAGAGVLTVEINRIGQLETVLSDGRVLKAALPNFKRSAP